jgi:hypothetical protein
MKKKHSNPQIPHLVSLFTVADLIFLPVCVNIFLYSCPIIITARDYAWTKGHKFSFKGKGARARGGIAWSTEHKWSLEREKLLRDIWDHQDNHYIKYPQRIPIDIGCGVHNPHVSLFVYPFGLFEDRNKSMTLMVKVTVPDECPPIPSKDTFELRWGVSVATKTLEDSKKPVKIKFKVGVKYIHKFLSHKALQMNNCERLEVRVHVSTNYSVCSTYPCQSEGTDL